MTNWKATMEEKADGMYAYGNETVLYNLKSAYKSGYTEAVQDRDEFWKEKTKGLVEALEYYSEDHVWVTVTKECELKDDCDHDFTIPKEYFSKAVEALKEFKEKEK